MKRLFCRNCGAEIAENYCPACGQRTTTGRLSWRTLLESITSTVVGDEAYGLRGINMRMGAVMTWWTILLHPVRSVREYIAGSRRKYFNPVAILLLISTVYMLLFHALGREYEPLVHAGDHWIVRTVHAFIDYCATHPAMKMLAQLPFYALALKINFHRRADMRFIEYFYVALFVSIFWLSLDLICLPVERLPWFSTYWIQLFPQFLYFGLTLRTLFGLTWTGTFFRTLWIFCLSTLFSLLVFMLCVLLFVGSLYSISAVKGTDVDREIKSLVSEFFDSGDRDSRRMTKTERAQLDSLLGRVATLRQAMAESPGALRGYGDSLISVAEELRALGSAVSAADDAKGESAEDAPSDGWSRK